MTNTWTEEDLAAAQEMWEGGYTAQEIARYLGRPRNSVIGKIYREGWQRGELAPDIAARNKEARSRRARQCKKTRIQQDKRRARTIHHRLETRTQSPGVKRTMARKDKNGETTVVAIGGVPLKAPGSRPCTILELRDGCCRFPLWPHDSYPNGIDDQYCGAPCEDDQAFCAYHRGGLFNGKSWQVSNVRDARYST